MTELDGEPASPPRAVAGQVIDTSSPRAAVAALARADVWAGAEVVGLGWTARTVHELHVVAAGVVRLMVERSGCRSVLVEGDRVASQPLDTFVRTGRGDPAATLRAARPFLATDEMLSMVRWLHDRNDLHPDDPAGPVRLVHGGADDLSSPDALEHSLAAGLTPGHSKPPSTGSGDRWRWSQ